MSASSPRNRRAKAKLRVLIVDDHPMVRERLAEILNREPGLNVCAEAEDRHEAIQQIEAKAPELAIIDLTLRNSDGLELIKDIHTRWPGLLMLVVSMHDESLYAERVIRAGARGYITKQEATRDIVLAVRTVIAGRIYLNQKISTQMIDAFTSTRITGPSVRLLADRELQVFELTGQGLNTRQISERLRIGVKTVETYRARIREKLKLKEPTDLLRHAIAWTHQTS